MKQHNSVVAAKKTTTPESPTTRDATAYLRGKSREMIKICEGSESNGEKDSHTM